MQAIPFSLRAMKNHSTSVALFYFGIAFVLAIGCDSSTQTVSTPPSSSTSMTNAGGDATVDISPTDVVSQFLDRIRRGGEASEADRLLTQLAQSELKRIGRTVQPIGSPDAKFQVTRAETVSEDTNKMLVQSIWTEPAFDGSESAYEVVWAMQRESDGWRISGLAMQLDPNEPPIAINFEDGEAMAKLLARNGEQKNSNSAASQAANPNSSDLNR